MLLPQMARQILVHHPFHQITEVLERHAAARTHQPLNVIINRVPQT